MIVALGAGLVAGAGAHECPMAEMHGMSEMGGMDCCKLARMQGEATPEVTAARLCCMLNCPQPAPTNSVNSQPISAPSIVPAHPAAAFLRALLPSETARNTSPPLHSSNSPPAYIQHLALLI